MNDLIISYDRPAVRMNKFDTWQQATLPIGNGKTGATVWGEIRNEKLSLNEETLWSGGRNPEKASDNYNGGNPDRDMFAVYNDICGKIKNGEKFDKEALKGLRDGYSDGYQPLGELHFDFPALPKRVPRDYKRSLSLSSAVSDVEFSYHGARYQRKYFASNPENVIACLFECENGKMSFSVSLTSPHKTQPKSFISENTAYAVYEGKLSDNALRFSSVFSVSADKNASVTEKDGIVNVTDAEKAVIYFSAATDYKNTFFNEEKTVAYYYRSGESIKDISDKALGYVRNAVLLGYEKLFERHIADYSSLYSRMTLDFGQSCDMPTDKLLSAYRKGKLKKEEKRYLEVLFFQYGRYLLISSSRENSALPSNLQGIWNAFTKAPWCSDIHININEQMNYWLTSNSNLLECALPLIRYVSSLREPGRRTAKLYVNSEHGFMAHTQNTPFGFTATGWDIGAWGWCPAAVAWLLQNCYDYYEYSLDEETLRNIIYPMMKEQVEMYEEILTEHNGRMVMPIAQSPEIGTLTFSNTYEQSLIWQLYADTIEASEILSLDKDEAEKWKITFEKLLPIEIGQSGQVKEWYEETVINSVNDTRKHRHLSNLLGLFPGNLFDTEEKKKAAYVSLMNKEFGHVGAKSNPFGGWTYAQLICTWARLGNGENSYYSLEQMIKNRLYKNLWDYHEFGKFGAFQIDANYGATAGVCEMLVQSNLGYIDILPALPDEWKDGSFSGITAEGAFEVSARWENKKPVYIEVFSKKGQKCRIKASGIFTVTDEEKNEVKSSAADGIITFETEADKRYFLS